ncbi:E3 ubiquitin-protein ligase TRIM11-like isoform X3 [Camarhynchus parvulus]|uniref:E3 ubiquitin-protein ligase TRIM11-like isoform X3 n=1 Tax=Geospiza parvula TaxID=87175 RepID=UPI001237AE84|nr:E3 ubiquitin-protein ligase TRIM11-like isoform X3 [Camarhynchus parvulus]
MDEELLALREQLVAEATCPLCLDVFEQPVLTACGHSFCGQCLAGVLGDPPRPAACPQCRARLQPGSQRPNRALGNVAGLARSLEEVAARPRCPQHGKALALFCEPCAALLCAPCRDGPEHGRHRVRPAEEAARELRETLQRNLLSLQEQKEKLEGRGDQKSEDLQVTVRSELQRVTETFEGLQQCLEEQKETLLGQLEQMSLELVNKSEEYTCRVLERQSLLDTVIAQIQEQRDQPAVEFLKDVGRILSSCEAAKAPIPEPVSPELHKSIQSLTWRSQQVVDMVDKFRGKALLALCCASPGLGWQWGILTAWCLCLGLRSKTAAPDGNHPQDGLCWSLGLHIWLAALLGSRTGATGETFMHLPLLLPVKLQSQKEWGIREQVTLDPETANPYLILSRDCKTVRPLALREKLQRIMVCLDYEGGRVTFYSTKDMRLIQQLEATFTEKVFPYFWIGPQDAHIRVCD